MPLKKILELYRPEQQQQPNWVDTWKDCFADAGVDLSERLGREHLSECCRANETFVDVEHLLQQLKERSFRLGLLSNATGPGDIFQQDLESRGLAQYYDAVVWSCDIGYRKPYHAAFNIALQKLQANAATTLMVGDSEIADIQGARQLGMDTALVCNAFHSNSEAEYQESPQQRYNDVLAITDQRL
ncbi:HAD family hydrolase [Bacterioplanes sanyensis]|uniref:HAD family hydrolase n=1 Tax=Bacterioplanes sanyensis TaxID=1249553 RepID=UPI001672B5A9|nr:HAD family hydrolase [Bacterioplanes sanyensis]